MYSESTPCTAKALQIKAERCKGDMSTSMGSFFLWPSSGDSAAYDDGLHVSARLCDACVSRHTHRVAWAPSPPALLADFHPSGASGPPPLGRDGPMDARHDHRLALWPFAQSRLLACASVGQLAGAGSLDYLATACQWDPVSV